MKLSESCGISGERLYPAPAFRSAANAAPHPASLSSVRLMAIIKRMKSHTNRIAVALFLGITVLFFADIIFSEKTFFAFDFLFCKFPWARLAPPGLLQHNFHISDPVTNLYVLQDYYHSCIRQGQFPALPRPSPFPDPLRNRRFQLLLLARNGDETVCVDYRRACMDV
jgi:hypothetical protein